MTAVAIVGGGPAGLMAAEVIRAAGFDVEIFERKGSVGRKFLIAGRGGLNLTHSEPQARFCARYGAREAEVGRWLQAFDADALRDWARRLGIETFVGSSGRVFPADMKSAPLLRAWVRRLREAGVAFHVNHRCTGWSDAGELEFETPSGSMRLRPSATVLALGGASWPQLGSDGGWTKWLGDSAKGLVSPLRPANCGFDVAWSPLFASRFAGEPVKPALITVQDSNGLRTTHQGEFVITASGIEGSLIYALSAQLRDALDSGKPVAIHLDLAPGRTSERIIAALQRPRRGRSLTEVLRRNVGIEGVQAGLIHELVPAEDKADAVSLSRWIKALPISLVSARPVAEAISTAGGVRPECLTAQLMISERTGVFCAGEMLDWEAPTGGYLLAASFASGRVAGRGVVDWLGRADTERDQQPSMSR